MTTEPKTKWYALTTDGDMVYLGEFATFDEADEVDGGTAWIVGEEGAREWLQALKGLLE